MEWFPVEPVSGVIDPTQQPKVLHPPILELSNGLYINLVSKKLSTDSHQSEYGHLELLCNITLT